MEIAFEGIILRDQRLDDIDDEIRWMTRDTAWMQADTPWEDVEPLDPEQLRADLTEHISSMPEDCIRWRLEIEMDGRHIGFVSSYYLDVHFEQPEWGNIDLSKGAEENGMIRALGIEICEADCWHQGIGAKALTAFMDYYRALGETRFLLETWSGNTRMLGCARKLGFSEVKRDHCAHVVAGQAVDAVVLEKQF